MNYNRVDEILLTTNIKKIELYKNEEEKLLNKIFENLNLASQYYQSENASQMLNNIENTKKQVSSLKIKREKYIEILKQVIIKYRELSNNTSRMFKGGKS